MKVVSVSGRIAVASGVVALFVGCRTAPPPETTAEPTPAATSVTAVTPAPQPGSTAVEAAEAKTPETLAPAPAPKKETTSYTVTKGDSLSAIAARFGIHISEIKELNSIPKGDVVKVGQVLALPAYAHDRGEHKATHKVAAAGSHKGGGKASAGANSYVIQPGDTLTKIARANKTTLAELRKLNHITGNKIVAGQTLTLPGAAASMESAPAAAAEPAPEAVTPPPASAATLPALQPAQEPMPALNADVPPPAETPAPAQPAPAPAH